MSFEGNYGSPRRKDTESRARATLWKRFMRISMSHLIIRDPGKLLFACWERRTTNTSSLFRIKYGTELYSFQSSRRMGEEKKRVKFKTRPRIFDEGVFLFCFLLALKGKETRRGRGLPIKYKVKKFGKETSLQVRIYWSKLLFSNRKSLSSCFCKI